MKRKLWICIWILLALLAACQPTPSEEAIRNRLDGTMQNAILTPAVEPYRYDAPAAWKEELTVRGQTILIDAAIETSDATLHPVCTVRNQPSTVESCMTFLTDALGPNLMVREQETGFEELLQNLRAAERGQFAGEDEETGELLWKPYAGQEEDIAGIKQQLAETPYEESYVPLKADRLELPVSRRRIMTETGEKWYLILNPAGVTLSRYRNQYIETEQQAKQGSAYAGETPRTLDNVRISEDDARSTAEAFLVRIGRKDMKIAVLEKGAAIDDETSEERGQGYIVRLVTAPEGSIPICYSRYGGCGLLYFSNDRTSDEYDEPWMQETVALFVTEEGILDIDWSYAKSIELVANGNVRLLPFETVQDSIRNLLSFGLRPDAREALYVERIVLSAAIARIPDQGREAFLIPVWVVFVRTESEREADRVPGCFMVNALDGSYVGRQG